MIAPDIFVPKGVDIPALDIKKQWEFEPNTTLKVGDLVNGGDIYGSVFENELF